VKLTLLVLGALFAGEAFACSCIKPDMSRMEKRAELVVLAQLDKESASPGKKKYVFAPIKTFKGVAGERIVVSTPEFEVSCGLRARRGVPYVLFVYREDGKLMVDKCSSWPLTQEYFNFTAAFNEFYGLTGAEALEPSSKDRTVASISQSTYRGVCDRSRVGERRARGLTVRESPGPAVDRLVAGVVVAHGPARLHNQ
jgi:hypothetical protein